jgi:hypothetical protein
LKHRDAFIPVSRYLDFLNISLIKVPQMPSMPIATNTQQTKLDESAFQFELSDKQRAVLNFYQTHFGFIGVINLKQYHFPHTLGEKYIVALSNIKINAERLHIMICLPAFSNKAFVILSDTDEPSLAQLTAFCCSQSESNDALTYGFIAELSEKTWRTICQQNWHGYLITSLQEVLEAPINTINRVQVGEESFETCFILLVNSVEYKKIKKTDIHTVLTFFKAQKRPLFNFKLYHNKAPSAKPTKKKSLPIHHRQSLYLQKNRSPFAGGQSLAEAVALRQKPAHTDPTHIKEIKLKLQQRLQSSQKLQPIPIHLVDVKKLSTVNKTDILLEKQSPRKPFQIKWLILLLGFVTISCIPMTNFVVLASPPPLFLLIAAIAFGSSLGIALSALFQYKTLNL